MLINGINTIRKRKQIWAWKKRKLETHHLTPKRNGGMDLDKNLVCLCRNCHAKADYEIILKERGDIQCKN